MSSVLSGRWSAWGNHAEASLDTGRVAMRKVHLVIEKRIDFLSLSLSLSRFQYQDPDMSNPFGVKSNSSTWKSSDSLITFSPYNLPSLSAESSQKSEWMIWGFKHSLRRWRRRKRRKWWIIQCFFIDHHLSSREKRTHCGTLSLSLSLVRDRWLILFTSTRPKESDHNSDDYNWLDNPLLIYFFSSLLAVSMCTGERRCSPSFLTREVQACPRTEAAKTRHRRQAFSCSGQWFK